MGTHVGRVAVRKTGSFNIRTKTELVQGINQQYCQHIHKCDGFNYSFGELVKQKVKVVKPVINQPITPTQLRLFDTAEFSSKTTKTKVKCTRKFKRTEGEKLS